MTSSQPPGSKFLGLVRTKRASGGFVPLLKAFAGKLVPVGQATDHQPHKDVVELLTPSPVLLGIVNLKSAVGRNTGISSDNCLAW
jgi:hypothetical protein